VVLGPASRLTVAATYGSERRDVELAGEAVFEVVHDPARPFAVRIGTVVIQDLGTTFAVRDDGGEVGVVVTSGSVLLRNAGDSLGVELRAGDRGLLTPGGRPTAERSGATADDLAWTQGRLVFNGAPMSLVKSDLRRWYGIELQIADPSLAGRHLTAAFSGEPADQVLNMVGLALGARIERRGDTAIVRAR
jgi:transmembrane sensor